MLYLRLFKESVVMALGSLIANKLRTSLSLLGITIGIFAIISVFTAVDSLEMNVRDSIETLGNDVIFIEKWPWGAGEGEYKWWDFVKRPKPNIKEMVLLQKRTKSAEACAFSVDGNKTIKYKNNNVDNATIHAVSLDYNKIIAFEIIKGRYFTETESTSGKNIVILGAAIANNLFGPSKAVGKNVKMLGRSFNVIGVIKKEGENIFGDSHDTQALIPVNSIRKLLDIHARDLDPVIMVKAKKGISNAQLKDELRGIMRSIRKLKPKAMDNFALNETSIISNGLDNIFEVIGIAGMLIGGFSILVGGFGIANIMFVSVKERTSIIGIQKSLGAKNFFILFQFLFEAIILCLIGGSVGLLLVFILTAVANSTIDMTFSLTYSNILLGVCVSVGIGVISGFAPALMASKMDPVEAIRAN
ncbi:MAG TPA: FtsX-like permease family protein [Flavobacteriales bacterium]|nr:FtsX-like permease family protein [Flavobacteriales bacterium]